ncbi:MAG: ABC transporter permease subunit [Defluviitaleaceae bacterium]|nr:ABC transporter permease subunit [Defluviitaleaceae bacterium]
MDSSRITSWARNLPKRMKKHWMIYIMITPFLLHLFFFSYRPMIFLQMAWMRFSPFLGMDSPWIGWENFQSLLFGRASGMFLQALRNTLILSAYDMIFLFPLPIIIAVLFHELKLSKFRTVSQSVLLLPNFFSVVIVTGIARAFLQPTIGIINQFLLRFGLINEPIFFIIQSQYTRFIYTFIIGWMGAGMASLIYLGSMMSIDKELYESAALDGAGRLRRIWHITIPGILPLISVLFIMRFGNILRANAEAVLLLVEPLTYQSIDVLESFVWRMGLMPIHNAIQNLSLAAAAGLLMNVVGMVFVIGANLVAKKLGGNTLF